jgi:hypothetical protein
VNIPDFQRALGVTTDGIVGPQTLAAFNARMTNLNAEAIGADDYDTAAAMLGQGVTARQVRAFAQVEAGPYGSFDRYGRPTILFERHKFHQFTHGVFSARYPDISNRQAGGYGKGGAAQWDRLLRAIRLDPEAAIMACSWGLWQVMGFHWRALGYDSALAFAFRMATGEPAQLGAFIRYIRTFGLADELAACRAGDAASCVPIARGYNGPAYARNDYHTRIAQALAA